MLVNDSSTLLLHAIPSPVGVVSLLKVHRVTTKSPEKKKIQHQGGGQRARGGALSPIPEST